MLPGCSLLVTPGSPPISEESRSCLSGMNECVSREVEDGSPRIPKCVQWGFHVKTQWVYQELEQLVCGSLVGDRT